MNNKERLELAEWAVDYTLKSGADETSVVISNSRDIEIEYRNKQLDKLQESTQNSLDLQIFANHKYSSHSTSDLRKDELKKFIEEAVSATKYLTEDKFRSLPDAKHYPTKMDKDLKLKDSAYDKVQSDERVKLASEIEKEAMAISDKIISSTAGYYDTYYENVRVHSNGFKGESSGTVFSAGAQVTVKDEAGGRPEDWFYATTRFKNEIPSPEVLGKEAAKRALRKIGQKKIESGTYSMLVENRTSARLLSIFNGAITARSIQQKSSFLDGMLEKKIASAKLTVIDNPFIEKGMGSRLFDGEGIEAKRRVIIDKGVLKCYLVDNYYGKKLGWEPNGGSASNIMLEYGSKSYDELLKTIDKGIVVTGFIGGNSNSTTGDFSFGIVGLYVEKGQIVKPVNEMNISGNAKEVWNQLAEIGNDPYPYSSWRVPSLLFDGIQFSGI
ncbi:MAG: TldD/PmbA family protein [Ignavibacteriaceae bacterium]|nr:TldD/PmbA family protein [Ignavibacteriaceae bacterium]